MMQSLLSLAGLDWSVPDYNTVRRRQKTLQVTIGAMPTTTGLHLLVDSTGIKMLGEGEWKTKKHGAEYRRQCRKLHLGIDAFTLEIRAMEVTDNSVGDAPVLPALLSQIPADERIASVSGDGAYDTKDCHEAIALRAADAIIPTRKNAKLWKANRCGALSSLPRPTVSSLSGNVLSSLPGNAFSSFTEIFLTLQRNRSENDVFQFDRFNKTDVRR